MSTKDERKIASQRQEKMVAQFLSWRVVSGSGARPTFSGDVFSGEYLGECKTCLKPRSNIMFSMSHWEKIENEAIANFRAPALFTDRGHQTVEDTWVLFRPVFDATMETSDNIKINKSSIVFSPKQLDDSKIYLVGTTGLAVASLTCFKPFVYFED